MRHLEKIITATNGLADRFNRKPVATTFACLFVLSISAALLAPLALL